MDGRKRQRFKRYSYENCLPFLSGVVVKKNKKEKVTSGDDNENGGDGVAVNFRPADMRKQASQSVPLFPILCWFYFLRRPRGA